MTLIEIQQKGFDRVVELGLTSRPGETIQRVLVIELMGRHSNFLLLDNQNKIITLGRQVRDTQSRVRPLGTGDFYIAPPVLQGVEPTSRESFKRWKERLCLIPINLKKALQESYQGISPSLALQLADEETQSAQMLLTLPVMQLSEIQWHHLYQRWCHWLTKMESEELDLQFTGPTPFRVWNIEVPVADSSEGISLALGNYYRSILNSKKVSKLIRELHQKLLKIRINEKKQLQEQEKLLGEVSKHKIFQDEADKILCIQSPNSHLINKAQKLYLKAKKLRRSLPLLEGRISHHKQRLENLKESQVFLDEVLNNKWEKDTEKLEVLIELRQELNEYQASSNQKRAQNRSFHSKNQAPNPLSLTSPNGLEVQVGRNHRQNEWISLRKSRSGDMWFHAQESPGSHVVLKSSNGIAEEADIQMAADLAAFFSRAKSNKRVPVLMVSTDHLQRIPGATPGTVRHRQSTICWGDL